MLCRENPRQKKRENPEKMYVEVILFCNVNGIVEPIRFRTEEGDTFKVSKVKYSHAAASQKAGGAGTKYCCAVDVTNGDGLVFSLEADLYHDGDFWFVEREQIVALLSCGSNAQDMV